jgi:hypothetical protein
VGAQEFVLGRPVKQRLVQPVDGLLTQATGELDQGGRMGHPAAQGDAAESLPADRVGDLTAQQLIAQPVAVLEEHQPQVGVDRDRGPAAPGIEVDLEGLDEHRVVQQPVHPGQLGGQPEHPSRQDRLPQAGLRVAGPQHAASNPLRHNRLRRFFRHSDTQATQASIRICWSDPYIKATSSGPSN